MNFLDVPQGRFAVLVAVIAESWGTSFVASYDLVAAAASAIGVLGALQRCRILFATYIITHAITLSLISAALLINVLPTAFTSHVPFSSQWRYDANFGRNVCRELDTGFGWDERWLRDCASSLDTLTKGAMWAGVVLMAAQWVILINVASWVRERSTRYSGINLEKREGLEISQEYKV
ncbi:hypothetical protein BU23DRAFT_574740 [Bimuria novae-zelandiae CBS 107.79]|uniref:Uncharacterized protein n=1 Tax=Bimuria novae-zelandiae CBS 107.79 TaxID=1447943 RepID=A0A6A5URQ9_9PLEO|nr:hypothetical protein BU23DRAFT_574740 [Bimuria novae-zelandiae CBS 107.79]